MIGFVSQKKFLRIDMAQLQTFNPNQKQFASAPLAVSVDCHYGVNVTVEYTELLSASPRPYNFYILVVERLGFENFKQLRYRARWQ